MINLTNLSDQDVSKIYSESLTMLRNGESYAQTRLNKAQNLLKIWKGDIWSDEAKTFFEKLDITPYNFPIHRSLINNMVSKQRNRRFSFRVDPYDPQSFYKYKKGRDNFAIENVKEFESYEAAVDYYDNYADDEYTRAISGMLNNTRYINKAKYQESECFEQGLITGLDFLKAVFTKNQDNTGISIERRSQRKIFFDESKPDYDPQNWDFVGEVHNLSYQELINIYPQFKKELDIYKDFTQKKSSYKSRSDMKDWENFYKFNGSTDHNKIKIVELWYKEIEPRIALIDKEKQTRKLVKYGLTKEDIIDSLQQTIIQEMTEEIVNNNGDINILDINSNPNLINEIHEKVNNKYELEDTFYATWYKVVFSHNAIFEYKRSPLPHNSHPYYPFYPQFNDGIFFGFLESLEDIIIGLNKALAFRELMMAHGAKGLFVINANMLAESGYSVDDISDAATSIGGLLLIKPKQRESIQDFILPVTTVGEGIAAINNLISDYDNRLYQISGVNLAQLGITQGETPTSRYKMQISEGETNNGIIFDNFIRTLEGFYNDKVLPLVTFYAKYQKEEAIKILGDGYKNWIEIINTEDYNILDEAVKLGMCNTVLVPQEEDPQTNVVWESNLMQMAMSGLIPIEIAFKYSNKPQRYDILRDLQKEKIKKAQEQAAVESAYLNFQQLLLSSDLTLEQAQNLIKKLALKKMNEESQLSLNGKGKQFAAGNLGLNNGQSIQTTANESNRIAGVIQNGGE